MGSKLKMSALQNLVDQSVDYAGLFPPASLTLSDVASHYANYLGSPASSMLGRLVIPVSRLDELQSLAAPLLTPVGQPWRISALLPTWSSADDSDFISAVEAIDAFNLGQPPTGPALQVGSIETKAESAEQIEALVPRLPANVEAYLEIDHQSDPTASIQAIARLKNASVFAKIRTGSVIADQIATLEQVARFLVTCAKNQIGFKATAGLHHPLRAEYRLTYEDDAPRGVMHGFLNVFVAAVIAFEHQVDCETVEAILSESSAASFKFDSHRLVWRNYQVDSDRIKHWRAIGVRSFGSCSFEEPTTELQSLDYPDLFAASQS